MHLLVDKGWTKGDLQEKAHLSSTTIAKLAKDEYVSMDVLSRICEVMEIPIEKVIEYKKD